MKMLFGGLLLAAGGLIALLSGTCSMWFLVSMLGSSSGGSVSDYGGLLFLVAMVGGIPFLIGIGLFRWGHSLIRSARAEDAQR